MSLPTATLIYCSRCRRHVSTDDCTLRLPHASAGIRDDYAPEHVHIWKHRACKELIFMPGRAPVERRRHLT